VPISNPDNTKERFPKEIPRTLFPVYKDCRIRDRIDYTISEYAAVKHRPDSYQEKPQPPRNPSFRTLRIDDRCCGLQNRHRHVRFVLPETCRGTSQYLDESLRRDAETPRRLSSKDAKRYGDNPSRYNRVSSDNKLPLRRINRIACANDHR